MALGDTWVPNPDQWEGSEEDYDPRPRCVRCGDVALLDTAVLGVGGLECGDCAPVCDEEERSE